MFWIIAAILAYLAGSVPCGYLVGRARGVDLRTAGSGNIGATNAVRVLGKRWGYLVFGLDMFKGWVGVAAARFLGAQFSPEAEITFGIIGAFAVVAGHNFPIWLGFKGGKGIATSAGAAIALFPIWIFIAAMVTWMAFFFITRYVSIASLAASLMLPISSAVLLAFGLCDWPRTIIAALLCAMAVWRHKENIERLIAGTERRFVKTPRS